MRRGGKLGPITMTAAPPTDRRSTVAAGASRAWFRIANVATNEASTRVDIYEEIGGWGVSAAEFVEALRAVATPSIDLHVNSPGGSVFDGVAIYNALSQHPAQVHGYIDGLAASAASFIVQACDTITMNPGSMMMVHAPIGMTWGNEFDHEEMTGLLRQIVGSIGDLYAARAGGDRDSWLAVMRENRGGGRWYEARDAVAAGLADKVAGDPEPDDSVADPPEGGDPRESFENSSVAAGHRLVQHYRDQVLAIVPATGGATARRTDGAPVSPTLQQVINREFGAAIAAWEREVFVDAIEGDGTGELRGLISGDWPASDKTSGGATPLVTW